MSRWFLFFFFLRVISFQPSRPCRHPSIRTLCERFSLGARWVFSFQWVLLPDYRPLFSPFRESWAPGLSRSHPDSAVKLGYWDKLSGCCAHRFLGIPQWFVHLAAYPQPMQQHRQLSCHGHHRSFLGVFPSSLGKF